MKILICAGLLVLSTAVHATQEAPLSNQAGDEISPSHLDMAYQVVFISRTSRAYNEILPNLARRAKKQLIEKYPALEHEIVIAVEEVVLTLAERQGELDLAISRSWAKRFSEQELREIAAFYATPTGTKLAKHNVDLIADGLEAARLWGADMGNQLIAQVRQKLKAAGHKL